MKIKIFIPILLIVGLVVALVLVGQNQEMRRGATGGIINLYLKPDNGTSMGSVRVGDKVKVYVLGDTKGLGVGGFNLRFRYDKSKYKLPGADNVRVHSKFSGFKMVDVSNDNGLVDVLSIAMGDELKGLISDINNPLISIEFEVLALGGARIYVDRSWNDTSVFGADSQNGSYTIQPGTGNSLDVTYNLGGGSGTITSAPASPTQPPVATSTQTPLPTAVNNSCRVNSQCGWCGDICKKIVVGERCIDIAPPSGYRCICANETCARQAIDDIDPTITLPPASPTQSSRLTPSPTQPLPTNTMIPTPTKTPMPTSPLGTKTVSFKVALAGVKDYSKCLGDNKVDVILLKGGTRKEYNSIPLVATTEKTSRNEKVFLVDRLNVSDFGETNGVAIFVKGPRHMQMKYGVNGQDGVYNKSGGELILDGTTVFDFSKYPVLAGDVNRDGVVDGIDFTEVKRRAAMFEQVSEGQYNPYDLDGSCVINNQDVVLLVQALNEKYDQMY